MENGEHPVHRAPPPWAMKAESYLLFLKLSELPQGAYDRLEEAWQDDALGRFEGGLGAVMIVRYTDTPVGRSFLLRLDLSFVRCHELCPLFHPVRSQLQSHELGLECHRLPQDPSLSDPGFAWYFHPLLEVICSKRQPSWPSIFCHVIRRGLHM